MAHASMNGLAPAWTKSEEQLLHKYWLQKLSAREISFKILGKSRNAIIGKLHRLGLSRPKPENLQNNKKLYKISVKINQEEVIKFIDRKDLYEVLTEHSVKLMNAQAHHCRWPLKDYHCCGLQVEIGSYCAGHAIIGYRLAQDSENHDPVS